MLSSSMPVALIMPNQDDINAFMQALAECNYRRVTAFTSAEEAYEVCIRQQFPIFVTRMEMPKMSGIVFIQKLRMSGNYGLESHLFVCDKLVPTYLNVFSEYDLDYVLAAPFARPAIIQKFKHMISTENSLSKIEQYYRDSKAAFFAENFDMAADMLDSLLKESPNLEKALLLMGDIKAKTAKPEEAQGFYKAALDANPKSTNALHKLAQSLLAKGSYNQAADLLNRLSQLSPHNIKLLENAGLSNFEAERYEEAKTHMSRLNSIDQNNRTAATVTAQVKIKTGDYNGLVETLSKSYDEKELIQFLNNAGAKLSQENDVQGAIKMYTAAVGQITDNKYLYAIHYNMGIAYKRLKQNSLALVHLEKSLKIKPDFDKAASAIKDLKKSA